MSRKERGAEKTIKPTEKTNIKSNLTVEEDTRRQELLRSLIYSKKTDSIDFKRPAEANTPHRLQQDRKQRARRRRHETTKGRA